MVLFTVIIHAILNAYTKVHPILENNVEGMAIVDIKNNVAMIIL